MSGRDRGICRSGIRRPGRRDSAGDSFCGDVLPDLWYTSETMTCSVNGTECGVHERCIADSQGRYLRFLYGPRRG